MEVITKSAKETQEFGEKIGHYLKSLSHKARVILLKGELGSGKTTFVQGFAKGLGISYRLVSPTFIIIKEYQISTSGFEKFYHIDLYRTKDAYFDETLQLNEILKNPKSLVVIEWSERLGGTIQLANPITVEFETTADETRKIRIIGIKAL